jgi:NAD kinase
MIFESVVELWSSANLILRSGGPLVYPLTEIFKLTSTPSNPLLLRPLTSSILVAISYKVSSKLMVVTVRNNSLHNFIQPKGNHTKGKARDT